jgi:hypothetical protein
MRMQSICHPGEVVNIASVGQGIHGKTLDATDPPRRAVGVRAGGPGHWVYLCTGSTGGTVQRPIRPLTDAAATD